MMRGLLGRQRRPPPRPRPLSLTPRQRAQMVEVIDLSGDGSVELRRAPEGAMESEDQAQRRFRLGEIAMAAAPGISGTGVDLDVLDALNRYNAAALVMVSSWAPMLAATSQAAHQELFSAVDSIVGHVAAG